MSSISLRDKLFRLKKHTTNKFVLLIMICACAINSKAQPIPCPPNIDFETGTFNLWTLYIGTWSTPATPPTPLYSGGPGLLNFPTAGRHELKTGGGTDPYGLFPEVAPGGGTYSLKLGNDVPGAQCERARYVIHVPANSNNYSFVYKYAVVFENPPHPTNQQPKFLIQAYDSVTGVLVPCSDKNYTAGIPFPGQGISALSPNGVPVWYLPWSTGSVNLSGQGGKTIYVDFETYDCSQGGHFGYGYVDMISCGTFNAVIASCNLNGNTVTLSAPPGYQLYQWYDASMNYITSGQIVQVPAPNPCSYFNVVLTPFQGVGCPDTLHTNTVCDITLNASPDTICYKSGVPVQLNAAIGGGLAPLTITWQGNGLSCTDCTSPVASAVGNQTYVVKVSDSNNCFRTDTLRFIESNFTVDAGADFITCVGTPVTFTATVMPATGNYAYNWNPNTGLNNPSALTPTYNPIAPAGATNFILSVDSGYCRKYDTIVVTTLPNDFAVRDTTICNGAVFQAVASGPSEFTYSWSPSVGVSDPNIIAPFITTDTTRVYTVTANYPTCPNIVKTVKVEVQPVPKVNLGPDLAKCQWDLLPINAMVTPSWYGKYIYQWNPNSTITSLNSPHIVFSGQKDTTLILTVTTPNNCTGVDSIKLVVHPGNFASITPLDTAICPNNSVAFNITGGIKYDWKPALYLDNANSAAPMATPVTDVDYIAIVYDQYGCKDTMAASIKVHPEALVDLPDSVVIYPGETVKMNPRGNSLYYQWWPPLGLSNTKISNPVANPEVSTRYFVQASTEAGCNTTDSIDVIVKDESVLDVPNAFTPGAVPNDILKVIRRGEATLKSFVIYNRWGTKLFETTNVNEGWDGKVKGTPQPMGVYVYTVEATTRTGKRFYKQGNVTLIR